MKKAFIDLNTAKKIAEVYPTPFYVYDEEGIINNCKELQEAFSWNKGYKEFFAVKANPNPYLLKLFHSLGCGMDCSSKVELTLCEKLNIKGDDIMFSSNATPAEEFVLANKLGAYVNFDDVSLIDFMKEVSYIPETVCIRYNPGGDFKVNNFIMGCPQEAKYGFTRKQVFEGVKKLIGYGVKNLGLHAFLASNTLGNDYYPTLAAELFNLAKDLHKEFGIHIEFVNLSGGIGIPYTPDAVKNNVFAISAGVKKAYDEILVPEGMGDVKLFTELGRYMAGPYGMLVSKVLHKKDIYKQYVGLDACAANLMRPMMYGAYHHITVLGKEDKACDHVYDVTGSLCENSDKFAIDRALPEIEIGDILAIHDAGAHGFSMGYNYNGKLRSAEVILHKDKSFDLIRRAETPDDYFATFDIYPEFK